MGWLAITQLTLHSQTWGASAQVLFAVMLDMKRANTRINQKGTSVSQLYLSTGLFFYAGITMKKTKRSNAWCKGNAFTSLTTKC